MHCSRTLSHWQRSCHSKSIWVKAFSWNSFCQLACVHSAPSLCQHGSTCPTEPVTLSACDTVCWYSCAGFLSLMQSGRGSVQPPRVCCSVFCKHFILHSGWKKHTAHTYIHTYLCFYTQTSHFVFGSQTSSLLDIWINTRICCLAAVPECLAPTATLKWAIDEETLWLMGNLLVVELLLVNLVLHRVIIYTHKSHDIYFIEVSHVKLSM